MPLPSRRRIEKVNLTVTVTPKPLKTLLHGEVDLADKSRWVRQARSEGKKLIVWVAEKLNTHCPNENAIGSNRHENR
jgi:hypothetical protein